MPKSKASNLNFLNSASDYMSNFSLKSGEKKLKNGKFLSYFLWDNWNTDCVD